MLKRVGKFGPFIACSGYPDCTNTREVETQEPESESGEEEIEPCENCGKPMAVKRGRFGQFLACTGYPECKTTREADRHQAGRPHAPPSAIRFSTRCARAADANLVIKQGRFGEFTACTQVSRVQATSSTRRPAWCARRTPTRAARSSSASRSAARSFFGCSNYPDCDFVLWNRPDQRDRARSATRRTWSRRSTKKHGPADPLQQRGLRLRAIRGTAQTQRRRIEP